MFTFDTGPAFSKSTITGERKNDAKIFEVVDKELVWTIVMTSEDQVWLMFFIHLM